MPFSQKFRFILMPALLAAGLVSQERADAAPARVIPKEVESLFPVGRTFSGVKIPSYSKEDVLRMVLLADSVTRVDQNYFDIKNLVVKFYSPEGKVETTVTMKEARYHLGTGELSDKKSDVRPSIRNEKFVMTGEEMVVDTSKNISQMKDRVRVEIPDAGGFLGTFPFEK